MELRKGDLIEVQWLDIYEDLTGDPDKGDVYQRVSIGYFWSIRAGQHGVSVFVTTTTMDGDENGQNGYCAYPASCVAKVKMIRRGKGKVYREQPAFEWPQSAGDGVPRERLADPGDAAEQRTTGKIRGTRDGSGDVSQVPEGGEPQA